ncbi:MAG: anaerobic ribonucleoside-triphosphate reductase [Vulcanimicrobiota bacterium]
MATTQKEMFPFPIIRKRDGRMTRFDIEKIAEAINKSFYATGIDDKKLCSKLAEMVVSDLIKTIEGNVPNVEEIQDTVEQVLIREGYAPQAKAYIIYRAKRTNIREGKSELMDSVETILRETHKKDPYDFNSPSSKMLRIAVAACRNFYLTRLIPSQYSDAHNRGDIHIHDLDYYSKTINSLQIPLGELLEKGFFSGYGYIRPPKHFSTITALTAIIIQSCQNDMYGGQSIPEFDSYLSNYIRKKFGEDSLEAGEVEQGLQGLIYNLNMIYSRLGAQVPMSTINLGLDTTREGRIITEALLEVLHKGLGNGETPLFPWVVFHVKKGVNFEPGDPNYDLFQKAIKTSSRRMNPSFAFADAPVNKDSKHIAYWGDGSRAAGSMSGKFTGPEVEDEKIWGWGNIAQVTLNLPRIAFKIAHKRKEYMVESFNNEVKRALELSIKQLLHRKDVLETLHLSELPFVMGEKVYRGTNRLSEEENIVNPLNYGIMTVGFVGLAEAMYIMHGRNHGEDENVLQFAIKTVKYMKEELNRLAEEYSENIILTASSSGYAAQRFSQLDRIEFGITPHVNDKKYYSQGFSLPALSEIPWEKKIKIEGKFHEIIPGGHFTYLESKDMPEPSLYEKVLRKMAQFGIALGGISFPLTESLVNGEVLPENTKISGRKRNLRRAAGLLLPLGRINEALRQELEHRKFDLKE